MVAAALLGDLGALGVRCASVVLVALLVAGSGLAIILYRSISSGVDDAAAGRVHDVVAALQYDTARTSTPP